MDRVFRRHRATELVTARAQRKFLAERETVQRLKYLKILISELPPLDLQQFFNDNYSCIFVTTVDFFHLISQEVRLKVSSSNFKELESTLSIIESIFVLLPELIKQKWQYNCIVDILEDLLNEKNAVSLRRRGIRLFLLWYQILGSNATSKCHDMFINLVPGFGSWITEYRAAENRSTLNRTHVKESTPSHAYGVFSREPSALVSPAFFEHRNTSQDESQILLQHFLSSLVSDGYRVMWRRDPEEQHLLQFWFLFEQLKRTYLPVVFPCLSPLYSIYDENGFGTLKKASVILNDLQSYPISMTLLPVYQEIFILWLAGYINSDPRWLDSGSSLPVVPGSSEIRRSEPDISHALAFGNNALILNSDLSLVTSVPSQVSASETVIMESAELARTKHSDPARSVRADSPTSVSVDDSTQLSRIRLKEDVFSKAKEINIVCSVLYGCRQNINLLHDVLRHAFLLPIQCYSALFAVVFVYTSWIEIKDNRPIFLQSIENNIVGGIQRINRHAVNLLPSVDDEGHEGDDESEDLLDSIGSVFTDTSLKDTIAEKNSPLVLTDKSFPIDLSIRTDSECSSLPPLSDVSKPVDSVDTLCTLVLNHEAEELRGCLQTIIQVILDNTSKVFFLTCPPAVRTIQADSSGKPLDRTVDYVKQQVELCRRILFIFRVLADGEEMNTESWLHILSILLDIMSSTLMDTLPSDRLDNSWLSNEKLIHTLFQTMNGALLRASILVPIADDTWNRCTAVYSHLTHWPPLINEWQKVMHSLTNMLAKAVYDVDLTQISVMSRDRRGKVRPAADRTRPKSFTNIVGDRADPRFPVAEFRVRSPLGFSGTSADEFPFDTGTSSNRNGISPSEDKSVDNSAHVFSRSTVPSEPQLSADCSLADVINATKKLTVGDFASSPPFPLNFGANFRNYQNSCHRSLIDISDRHATSVTDIRRDSSDTMSFHIIDDQRVAPHSINDPRFSNTNDPPRLFRTSANYRRFLDTVPSAPDDLPVQSEDSVKNNLFRSRSLSKLYTPLHVTGGQLALCRRSSAPIPGSLAVYNSTDNYTYLSAIRGASCRVADQNAVNKCFENEQQIPFTTHDKLPDKNSCGKELASRSVLAGGTICGWSQESIIVCWRRFLGILGSFNQFKNVSSLQKVMAHLSDLVCTLLKIQHNQTMFPVSNECVRPFYKFRVPLDYLVPCLFEAIYNPGQADSIKLSALRTLCDALIRTPERRMDREIVAHFYRVLHRFLTGSDERYIYEVIRSCGTRFFASELPASHILLLDFLKGVTLVLDDRSASESVPRTEALSMLSTLAWYSHHFGSLECLDPSLVDFARLTTCSDFKHRLIQLLIGVTQDNPNAEARCCALAALATHCVIELIHTSANKSDNSAFPKEAVVVLLGMLRFQEHSVALVATEMIRMLTHYSHLCLSVIPKLVPLIVWSLTWTVNHVWNSVNSETISSKLKRLLTALIVTVSEWCMKLPINLLTTTNVPMGIDKESDTLLSYLLTTLYSIVCITPTPLQAVSKQSAILAKSSDAVDPLIDLLSECQMPLQLDAFSISKSAIDVSSLNSRSLPVQYDHPWNGYHQLNETGSYSIYSIRLCARVALCHLLNHLNHFPMGGYDTQLHTLIQEYHDQAEGISSAETEDATELVLSNLKQPNVQLFVLNESVLLSCLALPSNVVDTRSSSIGLDSCHDDSLVGSYVSDAYCIYPLDSLTRPQGSTTNARSGVTDRLYTRLIIRDFSGKYTWDMAHICGLLESAIPSNDHNRSSLVESSTASGSPSHHTLSPPPCPPPRLNLNPPPLQLSDPLVGPSPGCPNSTDQSIAMKFSKSSTDFLNGLMQELTLSSPECGVTWNESTPPLSIDVNSEDASKEACSYMEALTGDQITAQCQLDGEILQLSSWKLPSPLRVERELDVCETDLPTSLTPSTSPSSVVQDPSTFSASVRPERFLPCRNLLNQLGFLSFERRPTVHLIQKSAHLVRDLKHLDKFGVRESHKIAVFYIGAGQEDKQTILSNQVASAEFENFVAGLGWEIDLPTHRGFRGGLEKSGRVGLSAPYYATSTMEVIFHVSTRMPSSTQEDLKYKHLGNDEVMIIWTENVRVFDRSVLRTQFGDVMIVISPLPTGLFRVEVRRESTLSFFGPIVQVAVLDSKVLPGLVRATAINASCAIRATKPGYRAHYEERALCLKQLISKYSVRNSFEDFSLSLLFPALSSELTQSDELH